jgi:hypothetical protein
MDRPPYFSDLSRFSSRPCRLLTGGKTPGPFAARHSTERGRDSVFALRPQANDPRAKCVIGLADKRAGQYEAQYLKDFSARLLDHVPDRLGVQLAAVRPRTAKAHRYIAYLHYRRRSEPPAGDELGRPPPPE